MCVGHLVGVLLCQPAVLCVQETPHQLLEDHGRYRGLVVVTYRSLRVLENIDHMVFKKAD